MSNVVLMGLYLSLGHLMGDFLFQPSPLVAYKKRSVYGVLLHVLIIFFSQALVLLPYLGGFTKILLTLIAISFVHFWIDYLKIKLEKPTCLPIIPFLIDQFCHFATLAIALIFVYNATPIFFLQTWWFNSFYTNMTFLVYFTGVIFFSYTTDIVILTIKLNKNPHFVYKRNYFEMLLRVSLFVLLYIFFSIIFFLS